MTATAKPADKPQSSRARQMADTALQGATLGLFQAYFFGAGTNPLPYVATAFAGGALAVAVKLGAERFFGNPAPAPSPAGTTAWPPSPTAIDAPLRKSLEERIAARAAVLDSKEDQFRKDNVVADGPVAQRRGGTWAVFDAPDAQPRIMGEREYARYRRMARDLVEIEQTWEGTRVSRLYLGRLDSSLTGRPATEVYDADQTLVSEDWFVEGRPSSEDEAMEAHQALTADHAPRP